MTMHSSPTHIMAKPTSYVCNIACDYCFYLEKGEVSLPKCEQYMSDDVLEKYVVSYIEQTEGDIVDFTWQGGEPTLAGLAFFEKAVKLQAKYRNGKLIKNNLQTNGILIDDKWSMFLKKNNFLVGLSCDGPEFIHDKYRKNKSGSQGTFSKVMRAVDCLNRHQVDFNILCVVTDYSSQYGKEIYQFFVEELNVKHLQFIPIVEHQEVTKGVLIYPSVEQASELTQWSVNGKNYGKFLNDAFDCWIKKDVGTVFVQIFDSTLMAWVGSTPSMCVMQESCGDSLIMESNGDLYSCDHFVYPEYKIGSIFDDTESYHKNTTRESFRKIKPDLDSDCQSCEFKFACQGGCPKHRVPNKSGRHNVLCAGYKDFFAHVTPYMDFMRSLVIRKYQPSLVMQYRDHIENA